MKITTTVTTIRKQTAHDHGHSHGDGEIDNLKITKFSDKYEIFAEINPFVVGNESEFIIHYTKLSDLKPSGQR
ncbi:hypothetical protein MASR1M45_29150 [Candidatus Kapaibacterium sp.]